MADRLLPDEKREEYLQSRDQQLTWGQKKSLHNIKKIAIILEDPDIEIDDHLKESAYETLRQMEMEILLDERKGKWDKIVEALPERLKLAINLR